MMSGIVTIFVSWALRSGSDPFDFVGLHGQVGELREDSESFLVPDGVGVVAPGELEIVGAECVVGSVESEVSKVASVSHS